VTLYKQHILKVFLLVFVLFFSSCSTKKKSWVNRQFHNTTAKYNGYFNGKQSMRTGVKKLKTNFKDDFTSILPLYRQGDLKKATKIHSYMDKAIKKSSVVIQRHSIKIKGREYCKWIDDNYFLVGKAYFYKGEYDEAINTFIFIKNEYKKNEISFEASLWLIKSYVMKKDFNSAEAELIRIENTRKFPKNLSVDLAKVSADFYLQQDNYSLAIKQLKVINKLIKRNRKKERYNYIMAQIYQLEKKFKLAKQKYKQVLKTNPEYDMVFSAKMNLAQSLESGSKDTDKMRQQLLKMARDEKNKEYLDQIYFTLAEMDINNNDTLSAIDNYTLSTVNSLNNNSQKAISFLSLARLELNRDFYRQSKLHYDSTLFYMSSEFRDYTDVKEKHTYLEELVLHLDIVILQDSLQNLAKLPKNEQLKVINQIIEKELKKEREDLEQERNKQQIMYENNRNGGRGEQFGNNTSGGKWYFYNPATLSFGLSEFRKKWGKRKLEDDWRRKDKKKAASFELDTLDNNDSKNILENKKDPKYYTKNLPISEEDFNKSNELVKESMYQAGVIYKEYFEEYKKSTKLFLKLLSRFPKDEQYTPLSYYNIYLNYKKLNNNIQAEKTKKILLNNFPNSIYTSILTNPNHNNEINKIKLKKEADYESLYVSYLKKEFKKVIQRTETIRQDKYKTQYIFLRALSFAAIGDTIKLISGLDEIIELKTNNQIQKQAEYLLNVIKNPENLQKANDLALTGSPYKYNIGPQMVIFVLPTKGVDINYLKTLISDFHTLEFENDVFEISAMMMGLDNHLLMVKTFNTFDASKSYISLLKTKVKIAKTIGNSDHKIISISIENFNEFYKNKDLKGYYDFYKKNYLDFN
tara:strand:+ start:1835 stop:4420 length:2586 start_codon:yes stop_codon:yes gene_type:complete